MFGLRADGKRVKNLDPIQKILPHIMRERYDAQIMTHFDCPCEPLDDFIKVEREKGNSIKYMDIMIAGVVRVIAVFPQLNRFIMNGRIFKRNEICISFVVKKGLNTEATESAVKLKFTGHESIYEVREKINKAIVENAKMEANNDTEKLVRLLTFMPNFFIKLLVGMIKLFDKHGLFPKAILDLSPFHASCFVTNMKSIKGPSIFHHLYEFGTTGAFLSMGKESLTPVVRNRQIETGKVMPVDFVLDERLCDGFYYVNVLNYLKKVYTNPALLASRLEQLPDDVEAVAPGTPSAKAKREEE